MPHYTVGLVRWLCISVTGRWTSGYPLDTRRSLKSATGTIEPWTGPPKKERSLLSASPKRKKGSTQNKLGTITKSWSRLFRKQHFMYSWRLANLFLGVASLLLTRHHWNHCASCFSSLISHSAPSSPETNDYARKSFMMGLSPTWSEGFIGE